MPPEQTHDVETLRKISTTLQEAMTILNLSADEKNILLKKSLENSLHLCTKQIQKLLTKDVIKKEVAQPAKPQADTHSNLALFTVDLNINNNPSNIIPDKVQRSKTRKR